MPSSLAGSWRESFNSTGPGGTEVFQWVIYLTPAGPDHYQGHYLDPAANQSTFSAQVVSTGQGGLFRMQQSDPGHGYSATYVAPVAPLPDGSVPEMRGSYFDSDGNAGTVRWSRA
ncbi:MAG: hypothetical protein NVSMB32_03520 [Actinomycetota bacterium]